MDTSEMNGTSGIVTLSSEEIVLVSGGKANEPTKSWWEKMFDWAQGLGARPSSAGQQVALTGQNLVDLQTACVGSGRDFHFSTGSGGGSLSVRVVSADGNFAYMDIDCVND